MSNEQAPQNNPPSTTASLLVTHLNKTVQDLDCDNERDLPLLVASCRALIQINTEIWQRCQGNHVPIESRTAEGLEFFRVGYLELKARTEQGNGGSIAFETFSDIEKETFPILPRMPDDISNFFHVEVPRPTPVLIDYATSSLEKMLCLKDEIARLFLMILKDHLKSVQVALGKIESWIVEPMQALHFLNQTFGTAMSLPEVGNGCSDMASCCYDRHNDSDICLKCFRAKKDHCRSSSKSNSHPRCPGGREIASFVVKKSQTLRTIRLKATKDVYQVTFTLCSPDDQERLARFLHFLQAPGTSPPQPNSMEVFSFYTHDSPPNGDDVWSSASSSS